VQTSVQCHFHVYPWQGDLTTRPLSVSRGVTGSRMRPVFAFLGKPFTVTCQSRIVPSTCSGSQGAIYTRTLTCNTFLRYSRKFWIPESRAGDQKSASRSRSDMFSMISISLSYHTPCFNRKETPQELQNIFFSLTYDSPSAAFPLPGALSNFLFHFSSCLNNITASNALGAPCSGSAPPSSKAYLYQHLSFRSSVKST
jgi:hypothetical protein